MAPAPPGFRHVRVPQPDGRSLFQLVPISALEAASNATVVPSLPPVPSPIPQVQQMIVYTVTGRLTVQLLRARDLGSSGDPNGMAPYTTIAILDV
jgi:hypothetical protein